DLIRHFRKHLPEIEEALGLGERIERILRTHVIHIAERDDSIAGGDLGNISTTLAAAADRGHLEHLGGFLVLPEQQVRKRRRASGKRGGLEETAPGNVWVIHRYGVPY